MIYKIQGKPMRYDWGGRSFIPHLLGIEPDGGPWAEVWWGTHPKASSTVDTDAGQQELSELIVHNTEQMLGRDVAKEYRNELPYLLKVLDVDKMLSIQAHPSEEEANEGFERENKEDIEFSDFNRIYKDRSAKPECMVALSEFWLLHGFKPAKEIVNTLRLVPEFQTLIVKIENYKIKDIYQLIMHMPQKEVDQLLHPLQKRIIPQFQSGIFTKEDPNYWAAKAFLQFGNQSTTDRGIFSIYMLNIVKLGKGEGIFQPAKLLHAYMEGQCVELMANSDNVLRGGLTSKFIAIDQLLKIVEYNAVVPKIITPVKEGESIQLYPTPSKQFQLRRISNTGGKIKLPINTPEIWICLNGQLNITTSSTNSNITMKKGEAIFASPGDNVFAKPLSPDTVVFAASVP